jgi:hypothetical protein
MGERRCVYRVLVGKPLGIPRHSWENNIKMNLQDLTFGGGGGGAWTGFICLQPGTGGRHM